jgi:hypothetical protein
MPACRQAGWGRRVIPPQRGGSFLAARAVLLWRREERRRSSSGHHAERDDYNPKPARVASGTPKGAPTTAHGTSPRPDQPSASSAPLALADGSRHSPPSGVTPVTPEQTGSSPLCLGARLSAAASRCCALPGPTVNPRQPVSGFRLIRRCERNDSRTFWHRDCQSVSGGVRFLLHFGDIRVPMRPRHVEPWSGPAPSLKGREEGAVPPVAGRVRLGLRARCAGLRTSLDRFRCGPLRTSSGCQSGAAGAAPAQVVTRVRSRTRARRMRTELRHERDHTELSPQEAPPSIVSTCPLISQVQNGAARSD